MEVYFTINNKEALDTWGVYMAMGGLAALMTPPANKDYATSECDLEDGCRVVVGEPKVASRDLSITLYMIGDSDEDFFTKYASLCEEFESGHIDIITRYQPNVVYKCLYVSCSDFQQVDRRLAIFTLRLTEPNPKDRSL